MWIGGESSCKINSSLASEEFFFKKRHKIHIHRREEKLRKEDSSPRVSEPCSNLPSGKAFVSGKIPMIKVPMVDGGD